MADFIIVVIVLAIVGGAVAYIVNQKKKGVRCVGCPDGGTCGGNCGGGGSCGCGGEDASDGKTCKCHE